MFPCDLRNIKPSDEVAVMPLNAHSPNDVLQIAKVNSVGHMFLQTYDGRMYALHSGGELTPQQAHYVEPVTPQHRAALAAWGTGTKPAF